MRTLWVAPLVVISFGQPARARALPDYATTIFRLPNGVRLLVQERRDVELVAVDLAVAAGAVDDPPGLCGLAHLIEHASVTGTLNVGSLNPAEELRALQRVDAAHRAWRAEPESREAEAAATAAEQEATRWSARGEIAPAQLERRGAVGINAVTAARTTHYFGRMPAAQLGYWMRLEANRLKQPLFRHFYRERAALLKELAGLPAGGASRTHSGPLILSAGGCASEVSGIDRPTALDHFRRWYQPERLVIAVVGPVNAAAVRVMAARHFGALQPPPATWDGAPALAERPAVESEIWVERAGRAATVWVALRQDARSADDWAAQEILREYLSADDLSPLEREIAGRGGIAAEVGVSRTLPFADGTPAFVFQLRGVRAVPPQAAATVLSQWLASLRSGREAEFEAARRCAILHSLAALSDPGREAMALAAAEAAEGGYEVVAQRRRALASADPAGAARTVARWVAAIGSAGIRASEDAAR